MIKFLNSEGFMDRFKFIVKLFIPEIKYSDYLH